MALMNFCILSFILINVQAATYNKSFSDPGLAFTYNSHLFGWSGSQLDGPDNGVPYLQGYFHLLGSNKTDAKGKLIQPRWTDDNVLRICF